MDIPTDEEEFGSGRTSDEAVGEDGLPLSLRAAALREKRAEKASRKRDGRRSRSPVGHLMGLELPSAGEVKLDVAEDENEEADSTSAISDDPPTGRGRRGLVRKESMARIIDELDDDDAKPTLSASPERVELPLILGQDTTGDLLLLNDHERPLCFRIQSTNPTRHYITPCAGILHSKSSLLVKIDVDAVSTLPPLGPNRQDKLRVQSMWLPDHSELYFNPEDVDT